MCHFFFILMIFYFNKANNYVCVYIKELFSYVPSFFYKKKKY